MAHNYLGKNWRKDLSKNHLNKIILNDFNKKINKNRD